MTAAAAADRPRLLWHSNAPWAPTGYGSQTALLAPRLTEEFEVTISANYGLEAGPIRWDGIPVLPGLGGDHGNTTVPGHVSAQFEGQRDGLVFMLYDVGPLDAAVFSQFHVVCWTPVDHEPVTPATVAFFRNSGAIPLAMSRFGQSELSEFEPLYCPHAVDTSVFKPDAEDAREQLGIPPDAFLVAMVAANKGRPSRKGFQQAFEAFRELQRHRKDCYLYCHTTVSPEFAGGEDLLTLAASLQIPGDRIQIPSQYRMIHAPLPDETLARILASSDVLLNPAMGEGFGIPVLEAAACGTPSIVTDFTAMPEVAGPAGWKVPGRPYWTGQASWQSVADVPKIVEALRAAAAESDSNRMARRANARTHALRYDVEKVTEEHLLPALREVQSRIGDREPVTVPAAS